MKLTVGENIYWFNTRIEGEIGLADGKASATDEHGAVSGGQITTVDAGKSLYLVKEFRTGRIVEMDDVSGYATQAEALSAWKVFTVSIPRK